MWQTVVVLLVLLAVAIYLVRHYLRVYRAEDPPCGGCSGCCGSAVSEIGEVDSNKLVLSGNQGDQTGCPSKGK